MEINKERSQSNNQSINQGNNQIESSKSENKMQKQHTPKQHTPKQNTNFSQIPNGVFDGKTHPRLNVEEIYLLCYLLGHQNLTTGTFETNMKFLQHKIRFIAHNDKNLKRIIRVLKQLQEKGYIDIENVENEQITQENLTAKQNLRIIFSENPSEYFIQVPNSYFDMVGNVKGKEKDFSLLVFIKKESFSTNLISVEDFQDNLLSKDNKKFSDRTIRTHLTNMKEKGIISIVSGKYVEKGENGKFKQEKNSYTINEANIDDPSTNQSPNPSNNPPNNFDVNDYIDDVIASKNKKIKAVHYNDAEAETIEFYEENIEHERIELEDYIAIHLQQPPYDNPYLLKICQEDKFVKMEKGGFNFKGWNKKLEIARKQMENNKVNENGKDGIDGKNVNSKYQSMSIIQLQQEIEWYDEILAEMPEENIIYKTRMNERNKLVQRVKELQIKYGIKSEEGKSEETAIPQKEQMEQDAQEYEVGEVNETTEAIKKEETQKNSEFLQMNRKEFSDDDDDLDFDDDDDFEHDDDYLDDLDNEDFEDDEDFETRLRKKILAQKSALGF